MLISRIINSIDKSIHSSAAYEDSTKAVWDDLNNQFSVCCGLRIHQLKGVISSIRLQGMTVVAYSTKLKVIWDELSSYSKVPSYTCEGYERIDSGVRRGEIASILGRFR